MDIEFPEGIKVGYELEFCSNVTIPTNVFEPLRDWFQLGHDRSLNPKNYFAYMYEIRSRTLDKVSIDVIQLMLEQLELVNVMPATYLPMHERQRQERRIESRNRERQRRYFSTTDTTDHGNTSINSTYSSDTIRWSNSSYVTTSTQVFMPRLPVSYQLSPTEAEEASEYEELQADIDEMLTGVEEDLSHSSHKNIFTTRNCGMHVHVSWTNKRLAHILFGRLADVLTRKIKPFDERKEYCCPDFNSPRGTRYGALRWVNESEGHFEVRLFNGTMKLRGIVHNLKMIRNEALLVARASQAAIRTQSANSRGDLRSPAVG